MKKVLQVRVSIASLKFVKFGERRRGKRIRPRAMLYHVETYFLHTFRQEKFPEIKENYIGKAFHLKEVLVLSFFEIIKF